MGDVGVVMGPTEVEDVLDVVDKVELELEVEVEVKVETVVAVDDRVLLIPQPPPP
jgi:hypothetical protein